MFKTFLFALVIGTCSMLPSADAQHHPIADTYRDYCKNVPRQFSPDDPWTMGWVLRTEVGFGGLFFNCDGEALKRYSPYITWGCQNVDCPKRLIQDPLCAQVAEIKQRIRWGSCGQCGRSWRSKGCQECQTAPCNCNGYTAQQSETQIPVLTPAQHLALSQVVTTPTTADLPSRDEQNARRLLQQVRGGEGQSYKISSGNPSSAPVKSAPVVSYNPNPMPPLPRVRSQQPPQKASLLSKILNPMTPKGPVTASLGEASSVPNSVTETRTANGTPLPNQPTKQPVNYDSGFKMLRR